MAVVCIHVGVGGCDFKRREKKLFGENQKQMSDQNNMGRLYCLRLGAD